MRIYGEFKDIQNQTINVEILTNNSDVEELEICPENGLWFSGDPIHIETDIDSTFEHLIRKSCTISFVTDNYAGQYFFANNARSAQVIVAKNNDVLFYGYIEPNVYEQGFAMPLEEFTVNCIDALSTLQYYKYDNITLTNFNEKKAAATNKSFQQMIVGMFTPITGVGGVFYDCSKGLDSTATNDIFSKLAVSEQYIIGEEYDDVWTQEEVLEEILKYLNLHIIQVGIDYYIFDWDGMISGNTTYYSLTYPTYIPHTAQTITLTSSIHGADDTSITVDEVYNQICVKDKIEKMDDIIYSPLETKNLVSYYTGRQLYMTEYISEGSGDDANDAINDMLHGINNNYEHAHEIDWFIQAMRNPNWKFYYNGDTLVDTIAEQSGNKYINQWKIAKFLKEHTCTPYIFNMGSVKHKNSLTDNSPISKIDMKPYLYISVNGNETDTEDGEYPTETVINNSQPIIEYVATNSGGVYSPSDDETTNYFVFSGKILFQPIVYESTTTNAQRNNHYEEVKNGSVNKTEGVHAKVPNYDGGGLILHNNLVKSDNNDEGRYYSRKFWTVENPTDKPTTYLSDGSSGIQPWTEDKSAHGYEYNYCAEGDGTDKFWKLPVLECEMIVGNKRLVEVNMDEYGNSEYKWFTLGQEPTETYVDTDGTTKTYQKTTFSLGINPKIGDYIIGQEYDIQNNIWYWMNLDNIEGTAIPIKKEDALSGTVIFRVLGVINLTWNDITRRHPSFWRHTKWYANTRYVLAHTENIIIQDFNCKIASDNAGNQKIEDEKDLIYMSDETDQFINKKEDIEFKFITQLTAEEAAEKQINNSINLNAVINANDGVAISNIYDRFTGETAKAEEHYVDQYFRQYSTPKILMKMTIHGIPSISNRYISNVLNKQFFTQSINTDVKMNKSEITIKEI